MRNYKKHNLEAIRKDVLILGFPRLYITLHSSIKLPKPVIAWFILGGREGQHSDKSIKEEILA